MPQTPSSSPLCQLWAKHLQKHAYSIISRHLGSWPVEVHSLYGHTAAVASVVYSPDGSHIVSGSVDKTIRVWNVTTGQCVAGPFQGHTEMVTSVAYSPDGSHIVSGSLDKTIRVWNATTGQCVANLFQGHTENVTSIAYSPSGNHIVSGSDDKTIRVWNATTGQCVAGPFQGHTSHVTSVVYSPDGDHIISGSYDNSIKVWKTRELFSLGDIAEQGGWILSANGACYGWIPPWSLSSFALPVHSLVISQYSIHQHDMDYSLFGESWASCWK